MGALGALAAAAFLVAVVFSLAMAGVCARRYRVAVADAQAASAMLTAVEAQSGRKAAKNTAKKAKRMSRSQAKLEAAGMEMGSAVWGALRFGGAGAAAAAAHSVFLNPVVTAAAACVTLYSFGAYRKKRSLQRQETLSMQLAGALPQVAANLKCGMTPERALRITTEVAEEPMRSQFDRLNAQMAYGVRLDEGLADMADRTGNSDIRLVSIAIGMQQEAGGELSDVLERIAGKIQARMSLRRHVMSSTASVRSSRNILIAMPWLVSLITGFAMAGGMEFWQSLAGTVLAALIVVTEAQAVLIMNKIINVKIE